MSSKTASPHSSGIDFKVKNSRGQKTEQWIHNHRLKRYEVTSMPRAPPPFVWEDTWNPHKEYKFDFEYNSDRYEPAFSEPEHEFSLEQLDLTDTSLAVEAPPRPRDVNFFEPRPEDEPQQD